MRPGFRLNFLRHVLQANSCTTTVFIITPKLSGCETGSSPFWPPLIQIWPLHATNQLAVLNGLRTSALRATFATADRLFLADSVEKLQLKK